ncbi:diguanylate cyclase [Sporosarcina sp. 179-K 3D1 HS]|uniref:diguanylate cyclase n=1 Tax=Sporosarcina sp. 179-K 3D1 HS TaxID=3232169 RepID=UPI00399F3189
MGKNYQDLLRERIQSIFAEWEEKAMITEKELYNFLHTLKGTSGTIGLDSLSAFCSAQLDILSAHNESTIPVHTLNNFKNRIWRVMEGDRELNDFQVPVMYMNTLDEETAVLIIDDDLEFVSFVKELLEKMGAQVIIALNGKRGIEQFYSVRPHYVLIDLYLPDMSGFEVLEHISETAQARQVITAITSVDASQANRVSAYENGAMDFLKKPLDMEIFIPYLLNREKMRKTIGRSVITDGLTGMGNRRHFDEMISYFAELSERSDVGFSLVMLDLDHFKKVNDQYGHPAGDEVLKRLGMVALEEKRETDHVFRYGGEEFSFIFHGASAEKAVVFIERLRERFNAIVFEEGEHRFSVTFSAGVATYEGSIEQVISEADQALYEAKRGGRNRTVTYNATMLANRKLHIMIIDDDTLIRTMLAEKLAGLTLPGVEVDVHAYPDGPSFLESDWYRPEEYYIVLLDGIMPEMDGLEVLSRLKRDTDQKNVLVSMMTARTGESDIKAALWLGADDYIMKPFQPKDIVTRVQKLSTRIL